MGKTPNAVKIGIKVFAKITSPAAGGRVPGKAI